MVWFFILVAFIVFVVLGAVLWCFGLKVNEIVQLLTAYIALSAVGVSIWVSYKQTKNNEETLKAQLDTSKKQLVESRSGRIGQMRQEWIEELRKDGAKILSLLSCCFEYRCPDLNPHPGDIWDCITPSEFKKIADEYEELFARISLRLKSEIGNREEAFLYLIDEAREIGCKGAEEKKRLDDGVISKAFYIKRQEELAVEFDGKWDEVLAALQYILKIEWERVKAEEIYLR